MIDADRDRLTLVLPLGTGDESAEPPRGRHWGLGERLSPPVRLLYAGCAGRLAGPLSGL